MFYYLQATTYFIINDFLWILFYIKLKVFPTLAEDRVRAQSIVKTNSWWEADIDRGHQSTTMLSTTSKLSYEDWLLKPVKGRALSKEYL